MTVRRRGAPIVAGAMRSAFPVLLATVAAAASGPGCASAGPERPVLPGRPTVERPDGLVPEGVTEMRESLAEMRAENRERMDTALVRKTTLSETPTGPTFWDSVGDALGSAVDVLSLRALGIW